MHGKPLVFVGELELLMLVLIHKSDLGYPEKISSNPLEKEGK